jgi:hypothetical protein
MKLIREIPMLTDLQIDNLEQFGFTIVYKPTSLEIWAEDDAAELELAV